MGLRRVLLGAQASPFCPSPSPLQSHTSFLKTGYTLNSLWIPSLVRFFSSAHTKPNSSANISETPAQDEAVKRVKKAATGISKISVRDYKRATDPEYLRKCREVSRLYHARLPYETNQVKIRRDSERRRQRAQIDPVFVLRRLVPGWIKRNSWVRDSLPWKTHSPIWYPEKVKHL